MGLALNDSNGWGGSNPAAPTSPAVDIPKGDVWGFGTANAAQNNSQSAKRQAIQPRPQIHPSIATPATPSPQSANSELAVSGVSESFSVVSIGLTASPCVAA